MSPDERAILSAGAEQLGVELSPVQLDALVGYVDRLERWNRVYNLTALRNREQMLRQHLFDSLTVVAPLRRVVANLSSLVDVGSGAGFPGAVIAASMSDVDVTCIDAVAKKAAFVRQAAAEVGLRRLHVVHARVEQIDLPCPDVVVSRAFATLERFVATTRRLVDDSGCWLAMKGVHPHEEIAALPEDVEVFHVEQVFVPGLPVERHLVWIRRRSQRPAASISGKSDR